MPNVCRKDMSIFSSRPKATQPLRSCLRVEQKVQAEGAQRLNGMSGHERLGSSVCCKAEAPIGCSTRAAGSDAFCDSAGELNTKSGCSGTC
jgi:hypothetical protein